MAGDYDESLQDEYQHDVAPRRRQRSQGSSTRLILAIIFGGGFVILLCCGGFGALAFFGVNVIAKEVEMELRDNPVLVKHIGQTESFEVDWTSSLAHPDDDVFVYEVKGTKGSGEVTAKSVTMPDGTESVEWATLRLPDGETVDLIEQ